MIKQGLLYLVARIINGIVALMSLYILTRLLSPHEYGLYTLGLTTISIISVIGFRWITAIISRLYLENPQYCIVKIIHYTITTSILISIVAIAVMIFNKTNHLYLNKNTIIIIWVSSILVGLFLSSQQLLNTQQEIKRFFLQSIFRSITTLLFAIIIFKLGFNGTEVLFSVAIGSFFSLFFTRIHSLKANEPHQSNKDMLRYGLPFILISLSTMILDFSDRYMIAWLKSTEEVAYYAAPYDLVQQAVGATLNAFSLTFYPRIIGEWQNKKINEVRVQIKQLSHLTIFFSTLFIGVFASMSKDISILIFSASFFEKTIIIMPFTALATVISYFKVVVLDISINLKKESMVHLYIISTMSLINIVLNYFLIPVLGACGASFSLVIAFFIGSFLSWFYGKDINIYPVFTKEIMKSIITILTTITLCYFLHVDIREHHSIAIIINLMISLLIIITASIVLDLCEMKHTFIRILNSFV